MKKRGIFLINTEQNQLAHPGKIGPRVTRYFKEPPCTTDSEIPGLYIPTPPQISVHEASFPFTCHCSLLSHERRFAQPDLNWYLSNISVEFLTRKEVKLHRGSPALKALFTLQWSLLGVVLESFVKGRGFCSVLCPLKGSFGYNPKRELGGGQGKTGP